MKFIYKYKIIVVSFAAFCVFVLVGLLSLFLDISSSAKLVNAADSACERIETDQQIDINQPLNIAVWNIYKLQNKGWDNELKQLATRNQFILLQESSSSNNLKEMFVANHWHINQAYAFKFFDDISGVMTLSAITPNKTCAFSQNEPLIYLPKTALFSQFSLSNGKQLALINIHSVNFTFDLTVFKEQAKKLVVALKEFDGPIIFAGDFNTWKQERLDVLKHEFEKINLVQVNFNPDERLTVFGNPLDHIFYRGLTLKSARSQSTETSDHAWLEASFSFMPD